MASGTIEKKGWTVLWENQSPTSSFAVQDVSVDLSKANIVGIQFRNSTTNSSIDLTIFGKVGDKGNAFAFNWYLYLRSVEYYSDKVHFSDATQYSAIAASGTTNNNSLIPIRIFSIP